MKLQDVEREALSNSAVLLKFATESPKTTPDDVVGPLVAAWDAAEQDKWSPTISTDFWKAYSKLCDLIKPVSMDTLSMVRPASASEGCRSSRWNAGRSRAQIHARRYLILLLFLVACAVGFGFIAGTASQLSKEMGELFVKGDALAPQISLHLADIKTDLDGLDESQNSVMLDLDHRSIMPEIRKKIGELRIKLQDLYWVSDQLNGKVDAISKVTSFSSIEYVRGNLSRLPVLDNGFDNVRNYYLTRRQIHEAQQKVALLNAIYHALVPLLLGAVGAGTYVLRLTSEQLRDSTFASSSPIRHVVRIALGSLAGMVVGLGGFNNELNLSSAALSFLAGYAVEPVFSTLDGIAEKFRRT